MKKYLSLLVLLLCLLLAACDGPEVPEVTVPAEMAITNATALNYKYVYGTYYGHIDIEIESPVEGEFTLESQEVGAATVSLKKGSNTITLPCTYDVLPEILPATTLIKLTNKETGEIYETKCPLTVEYEPYELKLSLPEYRDNFYPGQDHSKIVGTVTMGEDVVLMLMGDGIEPQEIRPDANGNFSFDTPGFMEGGSAILTAYIDGLPIVKEIRNLKARDTTMSWVSGGNLIVNGEAVIRRNVYSPTHHVSGPNQEKYFADDLHETDLFVQVALPVDRLPNQGSRGHETTRDIYPSATTLKIIDQTIEANRNKNFAYYYLSDEPEFRNYSKVYLQNVYEYIARKDPYHVILLASNNPGDYVDCADWIETDPYVTIRETDKGRVYARSYSVLGDYVDQVSSLNRSDKCIGFLPTCYCGFPGDGGRVGYVYPTFQEYLCNTWVGLTHGAKSIWPYAGHDIHDRASLYEGTRYTFSSIEALEDILLFGERTVLQETKTMEAVLWDTGSEQMFVVINFSTEPQTYTIEGLTGTWDNFRHDDTITGNTFEMEPFEVLIGTSVPKDAGIPSYDETVELIDAWENERLQNESLFFNMVEYKDFSFLSTLVSRAQHAEHKLVDGVRDNYAWAQSGKAVRYVELYMMQEEKPVVSKLVIYGKNLETVKLKVKYEDEVLVDADVADIILDDGVATIILSEPIAPTTWHFEFDDAYGNSVVLYEIEAY